MPRYRVTPKFKKRLNQKPPALRGAILECINRLSENPGHPGLQAHRVQGTQGIWEAYVDKANRVTYEWDGDTIVMRNHCNHDIIERAP